MAVEISNTPNPNALKFTVGRDVGGPKTFVAGQAVDDPLAADLLVIEGVTSIFMSADFVTLSKSPDADWAGIAPAAQQILERHFA
jgi:Scaffold protein Nfu/NifU N terminal